MNKVQRIISSGIYAFCIGSALFCGVALFLYKGSKYDEKEYSHLLTQETETVYCVADEAEVDADQDEFLWVNRCPEYLQSNALEFAQQHNLEEDVRTLYEADIWTRLLPKKPIAVKRRKKRRRMQASKIKDSISRWQRCVRDPRFYLPLDRKSFWLSSPFGPRRNPNGTGGFHRGVDMAALRGTPVKAAGNGRVIFAGWKKGYGKTIEIRHDGKYTTRYAHLNSINTTVHACVKAGKMIGRVGATGYIRKSGKDGSHLHFEVIVHGKRMNPIHFLKI